MGCHHFSSADGSVQGTITLANVYEFEGYTFEYHRYLGPMPVKKKTFDIRKTIPTGFWKMIDRFVKLTDEQKKEYLIAG